MTDRLRFGPGGTPNAVKGQGVLEAVRWCAAHDLRCMEMEFVYSTWLKDDTADALRQVARKANVHLTAHGSYYINLHSSDKKKREASVKRILSAARACGRAGGKSVTFHPAFYGKAAPEQVYATVRDALKGVVRTLQDEGNTIRISPETTGKPTQFGTYEELCRLAAEIEQVGLCVDFAHLHARSNGAYNTYDEFAQVLGTVEQHLGREGLNAMHIHLSGIAYGPKGEKHHLVLADSDMNVRDLARAWKDFRVKGWVISESPEIEQDALRMKTLYERT